MWGCFFCGCWEMCSEVGGVVGCWGGVYVFRCVGVEDKDIVDNCKYVFVENFGKLFDFFLFILIIMEVLWDYLISFF